MPDRCPMCDAAADYYRAKVALHAASCAMYGPARAAFDKAKARFHRVMAKATGLEPHPWMLDERGASE